MCGTIRNTALRVRVGRCERAKNGYRQLVLRKFWATCSFCEIPVHVPVAPWQPEELTRTASLPYFSSVSESSYRVDRRRSRFATSRMHFSLGMSRWDEFSIKQRTAQTAICQSTKQLSKTGSCCMFHASARSGHRLYTR